MENIYILRFLLICFFVLSGFNTSKSRADPVKVDTNLFEVYIGDLNNDGIDDYYFHEVPLFVLIHGEIAVPLFIKKYISFVVYSNDIGFEPSEIFSLSEQEISTKISSNSLRSATVMNDFIVWKNPGKEETYILLRGIDSYSPSVLLINYSGFELPTLSKIIEISTDANISDKTLPIQLEDVNNDGISDISLNGYVYLSDFSGLPISDPTLISYQSTFKETYKYDSLGRLDKVTASDGRIIEYGMDSEDNRTVTSKVVGIEN